MKILDYKNLELPKPRLPENPYGTAEERGNWIWNLDNIYKILTAEEYRLNILIQQALQGGVRGFKKHFTAHIGVCFSQHEQKLVKIVVYVLKIGETSGEFSWNPDEVKIDFYSQSLTARQKAQIKKVFKTLLADIEEYGGINEQ